MKISLNIKSRLVLWYLLFVAVLIVSLSAAAYYLLSRGLYERNIHPWDMRIAQTEKMADGINIITAFSDIGQQDWGNMTSGPVKTVSYSRDELLELISDEGTINIGNILIDKSALDNLNLAEDDSIWFYTYLTENDDNVVVVTWSTNETEAILGTFQQVLLIIMPIALVLSGILGYFCVRRVLRPVQAITRTAREIEEQNLDKRLEVLSNDELGQLASTLNHMLARLEEAFSREKQFIADASHELRTPLAVLQGETTLSLKKERNIEEYKKSFENISQETEHMSSMLKKLLFLARSEGNMQLEFDEVNLKDILTELTPDIEILCEEKSIHFQLHAQDDLIVKGYEIELRELFLNLLDNAIRYTPQEGNISITLSRKGDSACVAVKDTGIGIPEDHIKHIFERFYRIDKSRPRVEGGAGLGLAICRSIAKLHKGTIEVESKVDEGSTFSVYLPLVNK